MSDHDPTSEYPAVPPSTTGSLDLSQLAELTEDQEEIDFEAIMAQERVVTPFTRVLVLALVGAMGFLFGVCLTEDDGGDAAPAGGGAPGAGAGAGGAGAGGAGAAGAGGGSSGGPAPLVGVVKLVEDGAVYVADATGKVVKVVTGPDTKVVVSEEVGVADLEPTQAVTVQGKKNKDGSYTATAITEAPPGAGGGAGSGTGGR